VKVKQQLFKKGQFDLSELLNRIAPCFGGIIKLVILHSKGYITRIEGRNGNA